MEEVVEDFQEVWFENVHEGFVEFICEPVGARGFVWWGVVYGMRYLDLGEVVGKGG